MGINDIAFKCNETFSVISTASDPTIMYSPVNEIILDDDDITVVTSNVSNGSTASIKSAFSSFAPSQQSKWAYAAMTITSNEAIADLGATQIFIMDGTPVHNKQKTMCLLKVALADGRRVMSTHMCDIIIPGLPATSWDTSYQSCQLPPSLESLYSQKQDAWLSLTSKNVLLNTMVKLY